MQKIIKLMVQCVDASTGYMIEEVVINEETLSKAETLKGLGHLHIEQIGFLQKIQDFKLKHQIILNNISICPICTTKTTKSGLFTSNFHAALTDHRVTVQRTQCKCGWRSPTSVEGVFGSDMHPDLLKKQALQGSKESYKKAGATLNAESGNLRPVNNHTQVYRSVELVSTKLELVKISKPHNINEQSTELIVNIDGGHIKSRGEHRSFEAMIATVYQPGKLKFVDKNHNIITSKTIVASAKDDTQKTIKSLLKNACMVQGMDKETIITCLADGADNCRSIAYSIRPYCKEVVYILDWFHLSMKFKNIAVPKGYYKLFEKIKWHLWHGDHAKSLLRLKEFKKLKLIAEDKSLLIKLNKLSIYISNNVLGIVSYESRYNSGLVFTSNVAESTVNNLINDRQKGKQQMLWSRDGAHNVLQIRASVSSNSWDSDWQYVELEVYKKVA